MIKSAHICTNSNTSTIQYQSQHLIEHVCVCVCAYESLSVRARRCACAQVCVRVCVGVSVRARVCMCMYGIIKCLLHNQRPERHSAGQPHEQNILIQAASLARQQDEKNVSKYMGGRTYFYFCQEAPLPVKKRLRSGQEAAKTQSSAADEEAVRGVKGSTPALHNQCFYRRVQQQCMREQAG